MNASTDTRGGYGLHSQQFIVESKINILCYRFVDEGISCDPIWCQIMRSLFNEFVYSFKCMHVDGNIFFMTGCAKTGHFPTFPTIHSIV